MINTNINKHTHKKLLSNTFNLDEQKEYDPM